MNRQKSVVMIGLAALVAGSAALVYVQGGEGARAKPAAATGLAQADPLPSPKAGSDKAKASGPKVLYDLGALPEPVKRMLTEIVFAAESGNLEAMRPVLESRELRPMVAAEFVSDPIAYWKEHSVDGTGRDVLAAMLNTLASGFVLTKEGPDPIYVWPYFAALDLKTMTPAQEVEFYRIVPAKLAADMKKSGTYSYYRLGISPEGIWHYFIQ